MSAKKKRQKLLQGLRCSPLRLSSLLLTSHFSSLFFFSSSCFSLSDMKDSSVLHLVESTFFFFHRRQSNPLDYQCNLKKKTLFFYRAYVGFSFLFSCFFLFNVDSFFFRFISSRFFSFLFFFFGIVPYRATPSLPPRHKQKSERGYYLRSFFAL